MTKFWRYIFFFFGFSLVIISWNGVYADLYEPVNISCQKNDMQTPDNSSAFFSIEHDACEDDQIQQGIQGCLFVESVVFILTPQVNSLMCKICNVPWEPPKK